MTMQRTYFSILFFIRRTRLLKNGEAPIGLRITVNGQRAEMQIKRSVAEERWKRIQRMCDGKRPESLGTEPVSGICQDKDLSDTP